MLKWSVQVHYSTSLLASTRIKRSLVTLKRKWIIHGANKLLQFAFLISDYDVISKNMLCPSFVWRFELKCSDSESKIRLGRNRTQRKVLLKIGYRGTGTIRKSSIKMTKRNQLKKSEFIFFKNFMTSLSSDQNLLFPNISRRPQILSY